MTSTTVATAGETDLPGEPRVLYEWFPTGEDEKSIIVSDESLTADPVRVVPEADGDAVHSTWSRAGDRFTWEVLDSDGTASVWVAGSDGADPTEVAACEAEPCVQMSWPSFAPDDEHLLVTRYDREADGDWGPSHLVLVDIATGEQTVVASTPDGTLSFYTSTMSPDGETIAVTLETYDDPSQERRVGSEVVVLDADPATTTSWVPVTEPELFAGFPRWHPTEDRILFASWDLDAFQGAEPSQLYTVASDGSNLVQITDVDDTAVERRPGEASWTPDGERIIAAIGVVEGGQVVDVKIAYVDPDTGEISETDASGAMPALQPSA